MTNFICHKLQGLALLIRAECGKKIFVSYILNCLENYLRDKIGLDMFPHRCSNRLEGIGLHNKTSILGENHKTISKIKQFRNRNELNRKFNNKKGVMNSGRSLGNILGVHVG